ncbi:hypothetical protein [Herbaspirillum robiniae]|uniref:hypothetical protein n=1 Tax=Herbaspirillum robiniae TaxID=2014887 RepID=UPI003D77E232
MNTPQYVVAQLHARVISAIGIRISTQEEMDDLVMDVVKSACSILFRGGCNEAESKQLLVDACIYQLTQNTVSDHSNVTLFFALRLLGIRPS